MANPSHMSYKYKEVFGNPRDGQNRSYVRCIYRTLRRGSPTLSSRTMMCMYEYESGQPCQNSQQNSMCEVIWTQWNYGIRCALLDRNLDCGKCTQHVNKHTQTYTHKYTNTPIQTNRVCQNHIYVQCIYGNCCLDFIKHTAIKGEGKGYGQPYTHIQKVHQNILLLTGCRAKLRVPLTSLLDTLGLDNSSCQTCFDDDCFHPAPL